MPDLGNKTILIADDEEIICKPLRMFFEKKGFFALTAFDGEEAYKILQSAKVDVMFADLKMPKLSGLELIKKAKESIPHLPIVILSGGGSIEDATFTIKSGAFDYIQKPIENMDELERVINRAIERGELEKQQEILQRNLREKTQKLEEKIIEVNKAKEQVEKQSFYLQQALEMIEDQNIKMEEDLKSAQRIQEDLLPKELPNGEHFSFASKYIPSGKVGGDMFDAFFDPTYKINLYIADVAGHGVGAAMVTVFLKKTITPFEQYTDRNTTPKEILSLLNQELIKASFGRMLFVTMLYATFNPLSKQFTYASAGHPPFILKSPGKEPVMLRTDGMSLGWKKDPNFIENTITLEKKDRLIFFTDGLVDAMDRNTNNPYGMDKVLATVNNEKYHDLPPDDLINDILADIKKECDIKDDVSILALSI